MAVKAEFQIEPDLKVTSWKCLYDSVCGAKSTSFEILQNWVGCQLCHFIHSFTYYVSGTVLGSGHIAENQTDKVPVLVKLTF